MNPLGSSICGLAKNNLCAFCKEYILYNLQKTMQNLRVLRMLRVTLAPLSLSLCLSTLCIEGISLACLPILAIEGGADLTES
jgi:hypothetical protein